MRRLSSREARLGECHRERRGGAEAGADRRLLQHIHREATFGKEVKPDRGGEVVRRILAAKLYRRGSPGDVCRIRPGGAPPGTGARGRPGAAPR